MRVIFRLAEEREDRRKPIMEADLLVLPRVGDEVCLEVKGCVVVGEVRSMLWVLSKDTRKVIVRVG